MTWIAEGLSRDLKNVGFGSAFYHGDGEEIGKIFEWSKGAGIRRKLVKTNGRLLEN